MGRVNQIDAPGKSLRVQFTGKRGNRLLDAFQREPSCAKEAKTAHARRSYYNGLGGDACRHLSDYQGKAQAMRGKKFPVSEPLRVESRQDSQHRIRVWRWGL